MALGDPFDAVLKASQERSQGIERAFSEPLAAAQPFIQAKAKQMFPDPQTTILLKAMGFNADGTKIDGTTGTDTSGGLEIPAMNEADAAKKIEAQGYQPGEYQIKESKGMKGIPQYIASPTPEGMKRLKFQNITDNMPKPVDPSNPTPEEQKAMVDYLKTKDATLGGVVEAMGKYSIGTEDIGGSMGGGKQPAIAAASKIYGFDEPTYKMRKGYVDNLANGELSKQRRSANVLIGHLDEANQSIEGFQAQNLPAKEWVLETARKISGDPAITDLKYALSTVDNETEKFLTGVGVTQEGLADRRNTADAFLGNPGYKQLKQHVKTYANIMKVRTDELGDEYKQNMGKDPGNNILLGKNQDALNRITSMNVTQRGSGLAKKSLTEMTGLTKKRTGVYNGKPVVFNESTQKWEYTQ